VLTRCKSICLSTLLLVATLLAALTVAEAAPPTVETALEAVGGLPFDEFVDECYRQIMLRDPDTVWSYGLQSYYGLERFAEWTDLSAEAFAETCRLDTALLDILRTYDRSNLSSEQQLEYDTHEWFFEDRIRLHAFPYWDYAMGPSTYGAHMLALELLSLLPIDSVQDAEDYIARLRGMTAWMDQLIALFRAREAADVLPTQLAIDTTLSELDDTFPQIAGASLSGTLGAYTTFVERLNGVDGLEASARTALLSDARDALATSLIPAYRSYRDYISTLDGRGGRVGVYEYGQGAEYYEAMLAHHVTKSITPGEILALGEREVARLQSEMRAFATDILGWPSNLSMRELDQRITAANVPVLQGYELLEEYQRHVDEATEKLDRVFDVFPESSLVITVELDGPPAYYREPPIDRSGPGEIPTSLVNLVSFTAYDEPVLMHHEGNPGHHFQLALQRDLDLSILRRDRMGNYYTRHPTFQAFSEGWALYGETLAVVMGVYDDDPIGAICQKRLELVRLARLTADVGLNTLAWTWDEAAAYLTETTGRTLRTTESIRYDSYPGQACAYDMGYLTFLELRQRAMDELGDAFDLKEFHRVILLNGAIPLVVLESVVDDWLAEKAAAN
jgi:uncharacterized protein (DUF885 family)